MKQIDFSTVTEFENRIAEFFGAPYAVAVDSCTHAIELCLRLKKADYISCPKNTYLSVPMLADKLKIDLVWRDSIWEDYYTVYKNIIDAAVLWRRDSYLRDSMMCLSFQYQKHLKIGKGGMILLDNKEDAEELRRMSYDGRERNVPWREQNVKSIGYHYYMLPELAQIGLDKLEEAINTEPRKWVGSDWPNLLEMDVFKNK